MTMSDNTVEDDTQSPGHHFSALFQSMHDLTDKLLAIDYSKEFSRQYKCPPISRYYFCRQTNSGQQFYSFCSLASFLLARLRPDINIDVQEFDDPNATIDSILESAKNFIDVSPFATSGQKLRLGFGQEVVGLLSALTDRVLESTVKLNPKTEISIKGCDDSNDENIAEDLGSDEINATVLEEEDYDYNMADDRQDVIEEESADALRADNAILKSDTDLNEWRIEVERVLPQLKVKVHHKNVENEWRTHYSSLSANHSKMRSLSDQTLDAIQTLLNELRATEEKINSREKYLRQQLEHIIEEWLSIQSQVLKLRDSYAQVSSGVVAKSSVLAEVSQSIEAMKTEMELYSNKMTDSSPLTSAKRAKEAIRQELNSIELRIGVAVQTLIITNKN